MSCIKYNDTKNWVNTGKKVVIHVGKTLLMSGGMWLLSGKNKSACIELPIDNTLLSSMYALLKL